MVMDSIDEVYYCLGNDRTARASLTRTDVMTACSKPQMTPCPMFQVPRLGLAATFLLVLSGQLVASVLIDHFDWFTGKPKTASATVLLGVALAFIGALLVVRAR